MLLGCSSVSELSVLGFAVACCCGPTSPDLGWPGRGVSRADLHGAPSDRLRTPMPNGAIFMAPRPTLTLDRSASDRMASPSANRHPVPPPSAVGTGPVAADASPGGAQCHQHGDFFRLTYRPSGSGRAGRRPRTKPRSGTNCLIHGFLNRWHDLGDRPLTCCFFPLGPENAALVRATCHPLSAPCRGLLAPRFAHGVRGSSGVFGQRTRRALTCRRRESRARSGSTRSRLGSLIH